MAREKAQRMRVVFAGTPDVAVTSLRTLVESSDHDVVGVLTRPDAPGGRGRGVRRSPVAEVAADAGIEVFTPTRLRDPEVAEKLAAWRPDGGAVVAYGGLIPGSLLDLPTHGWINLHFSLLPAWRGAAPVQAAIASGDTVTGASTFRLEEGLDTGPVFGTITEPIRPDDTSGTLLDRLADAGSGLLVQTLDGIEADRLVGLPQSADGVSHAPKVTIDDAHIRWDLPAHIIERRIRAFTPAPGAWTTRDDERLKLGPVQPIPADDTAAPPDLGAGAVAVTKKEVYVGTSTIPVRLGTVQAPGKKAMAATDWARGARPAASTVLR